MRIDLDGGKYTYVFEDGKQWVLRNGKPWMTSDECAGNNVLFFMAHRIEGLEEEKTWLNVKNKTPPTNLCVDVWGNIAGGYHQGDEERIENCFYDGKRWWIWVSNCEEKVYLDSFNVTHWMYRPAPPTISTHNPSQTNCTAV